MTVLDWSDQTHWSSRAAPCRICGATTSLRDSAGRPAHKVCVEELLDEYASATSAQSHAN